MCSPCSHESQFVALASQVINLRCGSISAADVKPNKQTKSGQVWLRGADDDAASGRQYLATRITHHCACTSLAPISYTPCHIYPTAVPDSATPFLFSHNRLRQYHQQPTIVLDTARITVYNLRTSTEQSSARNSGAYTPEPCSSSSHAAHTVRSSSARLYLRLI